MIHEPDVTLTDYGLAAECVLFVWLLLRRSAERTPLQSWFALFFTAVGAASLAGGTVHGFFPETETLGYRILWPSTLVAIGFAALAVWMIGLRIQFSPGALRAAAPFFALAFVGYCGVVLFVSQEFFVAIVSYLPATVFFLLVLSVAYKRTSEMAVLVGILGLLLTFIAAGVQQGGVALHPLYFDHNALYHLIQAVALYLIYRSACWFVATEADA